MVFSRNIKEDTEAEILALWGSRDTQQYEKYLFIPLIIGISKKMAFSNIKKKIW